MAVLARLGLLARVVADGAPIERLHGVTAGGRTVLDLTYGDLAPGLVGLGVHRADLFAALWEALAAEGVPVRLGQAVGSLADPALRDADLVVVASGAASTLRRELPVVQRASRYPWGALWCIVDDPGEAFAGALSQVYRGTRETCGFLATGRRRVSLFWSVRLAAARPSLREVRARITELAPHAAAVVDRIEDHDLLLAAYHDVRMARLHHGRVVVIGDAGHAMSPQLGQGANLALIDAALLADCLAAGPDVPGALARFSAARRAHLRFYAWASRLMTPFFQSRLDALAVPRDLLMGPGARIPWLRRQMLMTLAGLKTGPLAAHPVGWPSDPDTDASDAAQAPASRHEASTA